MAPSGTCLIGLDLGTSAIKGVLTDARGAVLAEAGADTAFWHPREGWVEVDPEAHAGNVCRVLRELVAAAPGEVTALAMAAASGNALLTALDGTPLTAIINWMDGRARQEPPSALAGLTSASVAQVTGWPCVDCFPLAHLAWLRERQPNRYRQAAHHGMDTDWVQWRLTGRWAMDRSTATTFHLVDQVAGVHHAPFLNRLGLTTATLSPLVESGTAVGPLTAAMAHATGLSERTVVVAGCFDHPAAARAVGVLDPGQLLLSCGTSWVGFTPCADRQAVLDAGMLCDPFLSAERPAYDVNAAPPPLENHQGSGEGAASTRRPAAILRTAAERGPWGGMFSVTGIGRTIEWYVEHVIAPGEPDRMGVFNAAAAEAQPGAGGLVLDLRAKPETVSASRANVARAVMESAARLLNEKLQAARVHGFAFERAVLVGGPAASPVWPGIVSQITGLAITTGGRAAGARGAAVLAGIGCGAYRDEREALRKAGGVHDG